MIVVNEALIVVNSLRKMCLKENCRKISGDCSKKVSDCSKRGVDCRKSSQV